MPKRSPPPKPLPKQMAEFVKFHLADKHAFAPFTGQDYSAWHAFVYLVELYGRADTLGRPSALSAMRATLLACQHKDSVLACFKKVIPGVLDWHHEREIWPEIAPEIPLRDLGIAMIRQGKRVAWPCEDGPRICNHERSRRYKHATPEPGYTDDQECLECGAIWREKLTAT